MTDEKVTTKKQMREFASYLLKTGNSIRMEATGQSMFPDIRHGDTVVIDPAGAPGMLLIGDIIAWNRDNDMVLHRIIHIYESGDEIFFLTRGDSSRTSDEPVSFRMIAGRVTMIERKGKNIKPVSRPLIPEWRYRLNGIRAVARVYWRRLVRGKERM